MLPKVDRAGPSFVIVNTRLPLTSMNPAHTRWRRASPLSDQSDRCIPGPPFFIEKLSFDCFPFSYASRNIFWVFYNISCFYSGIP